MEQIWGNIQVLMQIPVLNLGLLIDGLMIGAVFALAAYGLALVWGVMNVKNLAQGDFVILGGYVSYMLANYGIHPLFGVPVAFVLLALVGGALYRTAIHRLMTSNMTVVWGLLAVSALTLVAANALSLAPALKQGLIVTGLAIPVVLFIASGGIYGLVIRHVISRDLFTSLLATFGIAIVLQQGMNLVFGPETQTADAGFGSIQLFDGLVNIGIVRFIGFGMAAALAVALILFMRNSRMGQAIRATAQDARAARVLGIDTDRVFSFTFSLNAAICGAAGALIVMIWVIQPFYGITYSIRSFVIVTAAGFGNMPGVIAAGLGMGVIEQFGGFVLGALFQQAIVVLLLLAVLAVRQYQQLRMRQVVQ